MVCQSSKFRLAGPFDDAHIPQAASFLTRVAKEIDLDKPFQTPIDFEKDKPGVSAFQDCFNPMRRKLLLQLEE
jgi:hypothetical protein